MLYRNNNLSIKDIRAGINAFTLIEKELKETNIPLKEPIIQRAFRLINKTVSDQLISAWIKKNRPMLECEKKERKEFEKYIKGVEKDLKDTKGMIYPDDKDSNDKLFIHEFLFLLSNCKGRNELIMKLQGPEFNIKRKNIKQYEMQPLDALRLDRIFRLELNDIGLFASKDQGTHNPNDIM